MVSCNASSKRIHEICTITSTLPNALSTAVYFVLYFSFFPLCSAPGPWPGGICFPSPCVTECITEHAETGTSWARSIFWRVKFTMIKYRLISCVTIRNSSAGDVFVSTVGEWCRTRVNVPSLSAKLKASRLEGETFHLSAKHKYKRSGTDVKRS